MFENNQSENQDEYEGGSGKRSKRSVSKGNDEENQKKSKREKKASSNQEKEDSVDVNDIKISEKEDISK